MSTLTPADIGKIKMAGIALEDLNGVELPVDMTIVIASAHGILAGFILGLQEGATLAQHSQAKATKVEAEARQEHGPDGVVSRPSGDGGIPAPITADMPDLPPSLDRRGRPE